MFQAGRGEGAGRARAGLSLVYHHDDRILTAATYGRGIWRLRVPVKSHPVELRSERSDVPGGARP